MRKCLTSRKVVTVEGVLTLTEAAQELGLKAATLRSQIRYGAIKAMKVGPVWVMTQEEVARYRADHRGRYGARATRKGAA